MALSDNSVIAAGPNAPVFSVTQLNQRVGELLESHFSRIWVKGEVSNFTQATSGHWYFTIKDEHAAVRAVMFRNRAQAVGFVPKAGERFEFRATVTLYEARGDYQLQVDAVRRAGRGDLHEAFLLLKEKLAAEGLFDPARKRLVAMMPVAVGVVTSLAAAALRDVLSVLARRAPHVSIIVYPAPVQGSDAAEKLLHAMQCAIARNEVQTLLLVRGGGSLEDLWSFNNEALARLVAASPIPVISGVGHETDFTIVDFVADLRAPTPTAAAELCCRARQTCIARVDAALGALTARQHRWLERAALRLDRALVSLVSPQQRLAQQGVRLQTLIDRLTRAAGTPQERRAARLNLIRARLAYSLPDIQARRRELAQGAARLAHASQRSVAQQKARFGAATQMLLALNPNKILARGYAIVRTSQGAIVTSAADLRAGQKLSIELGRGVAQVAVQKTHELL